MTAAPAPKPKSTAPAGIIISAMVIVAIASLGYFQYSLAPSVFPDTSTIATSTSSTGPRLPAVNVTMPNGVSSPPPGYVSGAKTQYGFSPDTITVVLGKNSTISWTNNDVAPHTATSDAAGLFDSGIMSPGGTFSFTLTGAGTYTYRCTIHPWMQATIIVKPA